MSATSPLGVFSMPTLTAPSPTSTSLEAQIQTLGRDLFARVRSRQGKTSAAWWNNKLMDFALKDEKMKLQLFRFVDVLPSLGQAILGSVPDWTDGRILPGLGGGEDSDRPVYTMDAKQNPAYAPLTKYAVALTKGAFRLTYYNYPDFNRFEFYDLGQDPEEMNDLYPSPPAQAKQMQDELLQQLAEINRPFGS